MTAHEIEHGWLDTLEQDAQAARAAYGARDWTAATEAAKRATIAAHQMSHEIGRNMTPLPPCGNAACVDLPDEPGPCDSYQECSCGWPAAPDPHCNHCQHAPECHTVAAR